RRIAIDKEVILHAMIATAADKHGPVSLVENVPENFSAADAVVHVNAHGTHAHSARFVNEIMADAVAAKGVIAPGVDGANIARFQRNVVDVIELNQVL